MATATNEIAPTYIDFKCKTCFEEDIPKIRVSLRADMLVDGGELETITRENPSMYLLRPSGKDLLSWMSVDLLKTLSVIPEEERAGIIKKMKQLARENFEKYDAFLIREADEPHQIWFDCRDCSEENPAKVRLNIKETKLNPNGRVTHIYHEDKDCYIVKPLSADSPISSWASPDLSKFLSLQSTAKQEKLEKDFRQIAKECFG